MFFVNCNNGIMGNLIPKFLNMPDMGKNSFYKFNKMLICLLQFEESLDGVSSCFVS